MDLGWLQFEQHRINAIGELVDGSFLQYILNLPEPLTTYSYEEYAKVEFSKQRLDVLTSLEAIIGKCGAANAANPVFNISDYIARFGMDHPGLYNEFRQHCGGEIPDLISTDEFEHFTLHALIKTYPSLLICALHHPIKNPSDHVYLNDELDKMFCRLLQGDKSISPLIKIEDNFVHFSYLLTNEMMVSQFHGTVLSSFLRRCFSNCAYRMNFSIDAVGKEVIEQIATLRAIGPQEEMRFSYYRGLYGINFEDVEEFELCQGWIIRNIKSLHIPVSVIKKTYSILNQSPIGGILEIQLSSRGKILPETYSTSYGFPELNKKIDNFKLALIFATSGTHSPFEETFVDYSIPCYSLPFLDESRFQHGIIVPKSSHQEIREWFDILNEADLAQVSITIKRLQLALFQKRNFEDAIIDTFIAWEGMFSAKFETTFQLCATIAKFLKDSLEERIALFSRLKTLYGLRSELAHGENDQPKLFKKENAGDVRIEILMIGINCLKKLLKNKQLLLLSPSERVKNVLLS